MKLSIEHRTRYVFERPVRLVVQSLRLRPCSLDGQRVIAWKVSAGEHRIDPGYVDGSGTQVQTLTALGPLESLEIVASGLVEVSDRAGMVRGLREDVHPLGFLRNGPLTESAPSIVRLAADTVGACSDDLLERAHALSRAVSDAIRYAPGETHAHTTAAEALAEGVGVCQDHAHVLIVAARSLSIPARYVTGYLFDESADAGVEASHAWAELYLGNYGWVGFDPANRQCPTDHYVRVACGIDARDAAPIRGATQGVGVETLSVDVQVRQAQQ